jgi:signal transduction histidine kinase
MVLSLDWEESKPMRTSSLFIITESLLRRPPLLWVMAISLTLIVAALDYATGYEVSVVLFYSVPIQLIVWLGDRKSAVFMALWCTILWWWADEATGHHYSQVWHQIWETTVRLIYFLLFVIGGSAVKARIELLERARNLEREIIRISEHEQQRIGRDLHDGLCQYLAAVGCATGSLKRNLEKQEIPLSSRAGEIEELIRQGVTQARNLARGLFPVEDDEAGLQSALHELAVNSSQLMELHCAFECDTPVPVFDNVCATHLYRIAQESISNASRHGKARTATIRLSASDRKISLSVADDGVGLPTELGRKKGLGLGIMRYRARMMNGHFDISPRPGGGTIVSCSIDQPS